MSQFFKTMLLRGADILLAFAAIRSYRQGDDFWCALFIAFLIWHPKED